MIGPELIFLLIIIGGYWLFRIKYIAKHPKDGSQEIKVLVAFLKKFGLTILVIALTAIITTFIVQGTGNILVAQAYCHLLLFPLFYLLGTKSGNYNSFFNLI